MLVDRYVTLLANAPFRRFWIGCTLSMLGDSFTRVAFTWFVYQQTRSAAALGVLMVCYTGPLVVGGFVAGWALDRFDRRMVMVADNLVRGLAIALVPLLYMLDALALWHVYAAAAVYGFLMMVALAGRPTLIPSLVAPGQLNTANALETLSYTLGGVIGPALAGLLIAAIGAPLTVLVDVASYLLFAAILTRLPRAAAQADAPRAGGGFAGVLRLLGGNSVLLSTTLMFAAFNIGGGAMSVWLPILSDRQLGGDARLFGMLLAAMALGETLSSLVVGAIGEGRLGRRICLAQLASGCALALILLAPSIAAALLALFLLGAFSGPLTIWAQTLRMQVIPPGQRGRAFALLRLVMQAGNPVGGALSGALLPLLGLLPMVAASAAAIGLPGLLGLAVARLRRASG